MSAMAFVISLAILATTTLGTTVPNPVYEGYRTCLDTAHNDETCYFYAYDKERQSAGFGYMFYNPNVCGPGSGELVGCTANLNFTKYQNYYLTSNRITPTSPLFGYFNSLQRSFATYGAPVNFNHHYCVTNCMFCKLLDSYHTNFDPFCPGEVCEDYGLDPKRCLAKIPDPTVNGIALKTLAPVAKSEFDIDTEYDISFSVYGVSNSEPYVGMPLSLSVEGCPLGINSRGLDAVPTGFTFQPDYTWLKDNLNRVTILLKDGTRATVGCSSISPNGGATERVVVFSGTNIGTERNPPVQLFIQGPVKMSNGNFTSTAMMSSVIGTLDQGTVMLFAERYLPSNQHWSKFFVYNQQYLKDPCPTTTKQIVVTTWTKGTRQTHPSLITYPAFTRWDLTRQQDGTTVTLQDGTVLTGDDFQLADDDDDNYVHVCLDTSVPAVNISFARGLFFDPRNTMNQYQSINVVEPWSLYDPYPLTRPNAVTTPQVIASKVPSQSPTPASSVAPSTAAPSVVPSLRPTASPTTKFTRRPTKARVTRQPTRSPTRKPTGRPTRRPTARPTKAPVK